MTRRQSLIVGGQTLSYLSAGSDEAPVVLLLHGLLSDATTWEPVMDELAYRGVRVIAPDLLGHGCSEKPAIGYGLADFAASTSMFLHALHIPRAVIGGHSLGGAIAMQFAHHYPEQTEGLVLVCAGGLGKRVHLVLRGATLPGARTVLRMAVNRRTSVGLAHPALHRALGLGDRAIANLARMGRSIVDAEGRHSFFETLHSVIQPSGQRGSMIEMGYLSTTLPTLIIWSEHDPIIPVSHAHHTHAYVRNSQLELYPGSSHEPHRRHPKRFAEDVAQFVTG